MIRKYTKKPVTIEAIQWTGENTDKVLDFITEVPLSETDKIIKTAIVDNYDLYIKTLEGMMKADMGDYIIKGVEGEFYPCKPNIFNKTYQAT